MPKDKQILVGVIKSPFGVKGDVRIASFCATGKDIFTYCPLCDKKGRPYKITQTGTAKGGLIAKIEGITTRTEAEALSGVELYAERANMPLPSVDEFYQSDLIGLVAKTKEGGHFGRVVGVFNHGAGDILEITRADESRLLLQFTQQNVPEISILEGHIVVSPPKEV